MKSCSNITKRSASVHALEQRTYILNVLETRIGLCVQKPIEKSMIFFVSFRIFLSGFLEPAY
jgi:hypothetical protein